MNDRIHAVNLGVALSAAKAAGEAILEVYDRDFGVEHKSDGSPLTIADRRSHEIITGCLTSNPSAVLPVLSEEGRDIPYDERKGWDYYWLIDPLDGTKEFIKRNGEFTVNIALIRKDRPVLGVIYIPVRDVFYFAAQGLGAYRLEDAGKALAGKGPGDLLQDILGKAVRLPLTERGDAAAGGGTRITVVGSRSHVTREFEEFVEEMKRRHGEVEFISAGSSLKFCLVAEGRADVYPRFGPTMEWDTAAGQAIVVQAGGVVLDVETGKQVSYNKENLLNRWFIACSSLSAPCWTSA